MSTYMYERVTYYTNKEMGGSSKNHGQVVMERYINHQQNPNSTNRRIQEPSRRVDELELKKQRILRFEQALVEEKRRMAKLEREKAKLKLERDQHKVLDANMRRIKLELENVKMKNKMTEAEVKNYRHQRKVRKLN